MTRRLLGDTGEPLEEIKEKIYQGIIRTAIKELETKLPAFRCIPSNKVSCGDVIAALNNTKDYLIHRAYGTNPKIYLDNGEKSTESS